MANIIIRKPGNFGKTRSEQEQNMRKEWGATMTDEQLSRLKFLEKKRKDRYGFTKQFIGLPDVEDEVK